LIKRGAEEDVSLVYAFQVNSFAKKERVVLIRSSTTIVEEGRKGFEFHKWNFQLQEMILKKKKKKKKKRS
jgi:hypothetical protein